LNIKIIKKHLFFALTMSVLSVLAVFAGSPAAKSASGADAGKPGPYRDSEDFVSEKFDVYELFRIEDEQEFLKRLAGMPESFKWIDPNSVKKKRAEYQEQLKKTREKYRVCVQAGGEESLPDVYKKIGDRQYIANYGLCKRLETGPEGCAVIKDEFPEIYKTCKNNESVAWFETVSFLLRKNVSDKDIAAYSVDFCKKNGKRMKPLIHGRCASQVASMLKPIRTAVFYKEKKKCAGLPEGLGKQYCNAVFNRDSGFCKKHKREFPMGCMENGFKTVMAVALKDEKLAYRDGSMSAASVAAAYLLDKDYCGSFYRDYLVPECVKLEKSAIDKIRVVYP